MSAAAGEAAARTASAAPEIPNFITLIIHAGGDSSLSHFLHRWENVIFSGMFFCLIIGVFYFGSRKRSLIPDAFQNFIEIVMERLDNMVCGIVGPRGREFTPFVGTLFLYILVMNLAGLVPGLKAPTSSINTTFGLSISVFLYVQYTALRKLGLYGTFHHLMGSPNDLVGWLFVPLMLPLHVMGEFIKPISLALRLFGNVMGEDALLASFLGIGIVLAGFAGSPIGVPLQFPIMLLALITSSIQALVFSLLTTVYIFMVLPHEEGAH